MSFLHENTVSPSAKQDSIVLPFNMAAVIWSRKASIPYKVNVSVSVTLACIDKNLLIIERSQGNVPRKRSVWKSDYWDMQKS